MNKHHPHNSIIERKLGQLSSADSDLLWNDMHGILDKKMPQKKERRRFVWWLFTGKGLLLLTAIVAITGSSLFFLSVQKSSTIANNKLSNSQQPDKFSERDAAKVSNGQKENITTTGVSTAKNKDNISVTTPSGSGVHHVINNSVSTTQTPVSSKTNTTEEQSKEAIEGISKASTKSDIVPVNLKSSHQDFSITTNHNKKLDSLIRERALLTNNLKKNTGSNTNRGFYTGMISGIDLSSVHFRSLKTGSTKGLIIGYAFNKKWSIESGFLWDTKRVYDNGDYFTPPGYIPSGGVTITAVNGKTRLYELPVNIKYTAISGRHNLFATTGLSSYFMRSENYDYEYMQNGQPAGHNYLKYKNKTKHWLAVVNFSAGYTHKLGDIGSLRVEPYLKLPLKNLGTGNMPIMSTGLNIGFTKELKR